MVEAILPNGYLLPLVFHGLFFPGCFSFLVNVSIICRSPSFDQYQALVLPICLTGIRSVMTTAN